jgi:hypothetical protein
MTDTEVEFDFCLGLNTKVQGYVLLEQETEKGEHLKRSMPFNLPF